MPRKTKPSKVIVDLDVMDVSIITNSQLDYYKETTSNFWKLVPELKDAIAQCSGRSRKNNDWELIHLIQKAIVKYAGHDPSYRPSDLADYWKEG